jgi:hypothetical protein
MCPQVHEVVDEPTQLIFERMTARVLANGSKLTTSQNVTWMQSQCN